MAGVFRKNGAAAGVIARVSLNELRTTLCRPNLNVAAFPLPSMVFMGTTKTMCLILAFAAAGSFFTACDSETPFPDPCSNADGALSEAAFIFVQTPRSGQRVFSGFPITGCSRTFEGSVNWVLKARDGGVLASGHTTGGGVDGSEPFSTTVTFSVPERQVGHLEVYEEDVSDGEGFPPVRNVIPLILQP
jgi:hypothetical protein